MFFIVGLCTVNYCQLTSCIRGDFDPIPNHVEDGIVRSQDEAVLSVAANLDKYGLGLCSAPTSSNLTLFFFAEPITGSAETFIRTEQSISCKC